MNTPTLVGGHAEEYRALLRRWHSRQIDALGTSSPSGALEEGSQSPAPSSALYLDPLNADCPLCGFVIASSGWVTHRGQRVHPSCFERTGEAPDSVAGRGKYAPGGEYGGAA